MLRQIASPSLMVTRWSRLSGGPGRCPQAAGPCLARLPSPGLPPGTVAGGGLLAAAVTASQASAHMARVTWRYQAACLQAW
jgi:hypothetical protein